MLRIYLFVSVNRQCSICYSCGLDWLKRENVCLVSKSLRLCSILIFSERNIPIIIDSSMETFSNENFQKIREIIHYNGYNNC